MKKIKAVYILLIVLCAVMVAGIFFVIGYKTAYDRIEAATTTLESQTFYASISDIRDSTLSVQGMDVNDINFRGDFVLNIVEETNNETSTNTILPEEEIKQETNENQILYTGIGMICISIIFFIISIIFFIK